MAPFWPLVTTGFFSNLDEGIIASYCDLQRVVEETSPSRPLFAAQVVKESGEPLVNKLLSSVGLEKISQFKVRI